MTKKIQQLSLVFILSVIFGLVLLFPMGNFLSQPVAAEIPANHTVKSTTEDINPIKPEPSAFNKSEIQVDNLAPIPVVEDVSDLLIKPQLKPANRVKAGTLSCEVSQVTNTTGSINDEPAISDDGDRITFWSTADLDPDGNNIDGNTEIFLATFRIGTNKAFVQLTETNGNILGGFNFSPNIDKKKDTNNSRIVFFSDDIDGITKDIQNDNRTGNFEVFLADVDFLPEPPVVSTTQVTFSDNGFNISPSLSGNSNAAAFASDEDLTGTGSNIDDEAQQRGNAEIFVVDLTDISVFTDVHFTQVTSSTDGINQDAVLNKDGTKLAFVSDRDLVTGQNPNRTDQIFLAKINKANNNAVTIIQVSNDTTLEHHSPTINGDGSLVAYIVQDQDQFGTDVDRLVRSEIHPNGFPITRTTILSVGNNSAPSLNTTGNLLVFVSDQDLESGFNADGSQEVFLASLGGGVSRFLQVTTATNTTANMDVPTINDAGTFVALASDADLDPTVGNADGNREIFQAQCDIASIKIAKTGAFSQAVAGEIFTYTIHITNASSSIAESVFFTDTLPDSIMGATIAVTPGLPKCNADRNIIPPIVFCDFGDLAPESNQVITITGRVDPDTRQGITNRADVRADTFDPADSINTARLETEVLAQANLELTKNHYQGATPVAGQSFTYSLIVTNTGPSNATDVILTDYLPFDENGYVTFKSTTPDICTGNDTEVICNIGTLNVTNSVEITIAVNLSEFITQTLENVATVIGAEDNAYATVNLSSPIDTRFDLDVTKAPVTPTITAGRLVTYTFNVHNAGPSSASNVTLYDDIPLGLTYDSYDSTDGNITCSQVVITNTQIMTYYVATGTYVSCDMGSISFNANKQVDLSFITDPSLDSGMLITNTVVVSATGRDREPLDNMTKATITMTTQADLVVNKESPDAIAGSPFTYTLSVFNAGPSDALGVLLTDTLDSGTPFDSFIFNGSLCNHSSGEITCDLGIITATQTITVGVVVDIDTGALGDTVTNIVTASTTTPEDVTTNNYKSISDLVTALARLAIAKKANLTEVTAGELLVYTVFITNSGPSQAESVTMTDYYPAGTVVAATTLDPEGTCNQNDPIVCNFTTIDVDETVIATLTIEIDPSTTNPDITGSVENQVFVDAYTADTPANNDDTVITLVNTEATLVMNKITLITPTAGLGVQYLIAITNTGPSDAVGVVVTDSLPLTTLYNDIQIDSNDGTCDINLGSPRCTLTPIPFSSTVFITLTLDVESSADGNLTNEVTATMLTPGSTGPLATVTDNIHKETQLLLSKEGSHFEAEAGSPDIFTYTITVVNNGPSDATNVTITDTLPADMTYNITATNNPYTCIHNAGEVVCDIGYLSDQASAEVKIGITVDATGKGEVINEAIVTSFEGGYDLVTTTTDIYRVTGLTATKHVNAPTVIAGATPLLTYTIYVSNTGIAFISNVLITDTLPDHVGYLASSPECNHSAGVVTCDLGVIPNNSPYTHPITITVAVSSSALSEIYNEAKVSDAEGGLKTINATSVVNRITSIGLTKEASGSYIAGTVLTYTLTAVNNGPSDASNVVITDTLPMSMTYSSDNFGCTHNSGDVICDIGVLTASTTISIEILVDVNGFARGNIDNSALMTHNEGVDVSANVNVLVTKEISLTLAKDDEPSTMLAGSSAEMEYTITITNNGPSNAIGVIVTDTLPIEVTYQNSDDRCTYTMLSRLVSCDIGNLVDDEIDTITITVTVNPEADYRIKNYVRAYDEDNLYFGPILEKTVITRETNLLISKQGSFASVVAGDGQNLDYYLAITNTGPSYASMLTITDQLPISVTYSGYVAYGNGSCTPVGRVVTCTIAELANNASQIITLNVSVDSDALTQIQNTAHVTDAEGYSASSGTETTLVTRRSDISVTKTIADVAVAGEPLIYSIAITNQGPSVAKGIIVTDTLPLSVTYNTFAGDADNCIQNGGNARLITCTISTIAAGTEAIIDIIVDVDNGAKDKVLTNQATISSIYPDDVITNNVTSIANTVLGKSNLWITKTAISPAIAGMNVSYLITVTNHGSSDSSAKLDAITDTIPLGLTYIDEESTLDCEAPIDDVWCDLPALAVGESHIVSLTFAILASRGTPGDTIENSAGVDGLEQDDFPFNNVSLETIPITREARLWITKTAISPAIAGKNVSYLITVTNYGPSYASATTDAITDTIPSGLTFVGSDDPTCGVNAGKVKCDLPTLTVNASHIISMTFSIPSSRGTPGDTIDNSAGVAGSDTDPNLVNNVDLESVAVTRSTDLAIAKTAITPAVAGTNVSYLITVTNQGPSDASANTDGIVDTIPAGLTYESDNGSCTIGADITCDLSALTVGTSQVINVTFSIPPSESDGTVFNNTATVAGIEPDPNSGNNNASESITVDLVADLGVIKTLITPPVIGGPAQYLITVTNYGPSNFPGEEPSLTSLVDDVPALMSYQAAGPNCTYESLPRKVYCGLPSLLVGQQSEITMTFLVNSSIAEGTPIANTATAYGDYEPVGGGIAHSSTASANFYHPIDLSIVKTGDNQVRDNRDNISTYVIMVTNEGTFTANNILVVDVLPPDPPIKHDASKLHFNPPPTGGAICTDVDVATTGEVSCSIVSLAPGAQSVISVLFSTRQIGDHILVRNNVSVSADQPDLNLSNNTAYKDTTVCDGDPPCSAFNLSLKEPKYYLTGPYFKRSYPY